MYKVTVLLVGILKGHLRFYYFFVTYYKIERALGDHHGLMINTA